MKATHISVAGMIQSVGGAKGKENEGCHALTLSEIGCSSQTNLSAGLPGLQAQVGLALCFLMPLGLD